MGNKQLNKLVISFQEEPSDETFMKIHEEVLAKWKKTNMIKSLGRKYRLDFAEVESLAYFKLQDVVKKYNPSGDFYNMLSVSISRGCLDLWRGKNSYDQEISLDFCLDSDDDSDTSLSDFIPCANAEEEITEYLQRNSDQRQLIAQLIDKAPEKCSQAAKAFVRCNFSYSAAAKLLNTSLPTVKRRIEKLATYFDANQNGDYRDFFTVATA